MAIVAKTANKPFYVAVESYKFVRFFPLNQYDLPAEVTSTLNLMFDKTELDQESTPEVSFSFISFFPFFPKN